MNAPVQQKYSAESIRSDGCYGNGDDTHSGFYAYAVVDDDGRVLFDTLNRDHRLSEIHNDVDDGYVSAWDEPARVDIELAADAFNTFAATGKRPSELAEQVSRFRALAESLPDEPSRAFMLARLEEMK